MGHDEVKIREYTKMIYELLNSDRDVVQGTGGFTGEGKSNLQL